MRLWSIHPQYLDSKGLVAVWREGLLARAVLKGTTRGYRNHPQLVRFRQEPDPLASIDTYLNHIYLEACQRNYCFNQEKMGHLRTRKKIPVTRGQLTYELEHLKGKLRQRDLEKYLQIRDLALPVPHPLFRMIEGGVESWEKLKRS
jgi:hypothetical protein